MEGRTQPQQACLTSKVAQSQGEELALEIDLDFVALLCERLSSGFCNENATD